MTIKMFLLLFLMIVSFPIHAQQTGMVPKMSGLKGRALRGFTLLKTTNTPTGKVEVWKRDSDGAQLRIEVVPKATAAIAQIRINAVNSKIAEPGKDSEELLFRYASEGNNFGWTNYRATHHTTFATYRYWKLQGGTLIQSDMTFTKGKPDADAARGAFLAAKKAADNTLYSLGL